MRDGRSEMAVRSERAPLLTFVPHNKQGLRGVPGTRYFIQFSAILPADLNGAVSLPKHPHCPNWTCVDYPKMSATASAMSAVADCRGAHRALDSGPLRLSDLPRGRGTGSRGRARHASPLRGSAPASREFCRGVACYALTAAAPRALSPCRPIPVNV